MIVFFGGRGGGGMLCVSVLATCVFFGKKNDPFFSMVNWERLGYRKSDDDNISQRHPPHSKHFFDWIGFDAISILLLLGYFYETSLLPRHCVFIV
jgi:hypothetical protein